jgi:uncharacterized membrane protein
MTTIASLARAAYAIAILAFGVQHLVYGAFVTRLVPKLPAWIPWHPVWAYLTGIALLAVGLALLLGKAARTAATLLGIFLLISFLLLYLPQLAVTAPLSGLWTNAGKALALAAGAFLFAYSLAQQRSGGPISSSPERFFPLSRFLLSAFLILAGVQHFLFVPFVATLVPAWIPGHVFWTYFAGVALIAGGLGMCVPHTARLAGMLSGSMIFIWLIVLHIPRAIAAPHDSNETTAVFEALAVSATAFLVAATAGSTAVKSSAGSPGSSMLYR